MVDVTQFPWNYSSVSLLLHCIGVLRKVILMALRLRPPLPFPPPSISGMHGGSMNFSPASWMVASLRYPGVHSGNSTNPLPSEQPALVSKGLAKKQHQEDLHLAAQDPVRKEAMMVEDEESQPQQNSFDKNSSSKRSDYQNDKPIAPGKGGEASRKMRIRPSSIAIPKRGSDLVFDEVGIDESDDKESLVEGECFFLASKRGKRKITEDDYHVVTNIHGDSKQAYFGVFDGHGGRAAVDYVVENLGKNIIAALEETEKGESQLEEAIRRGYLTTDNGFINKGIESGVCVATVILRDEELNATNVGDCRVVLSRKGIAEALTGDHRVEREDEKLRIQRTGGFVSCHNGVWRVHSSLAVSRAIGDAHLKEWIISEPETKRIRLTSDCDFLIMASDGLWDKVGNQEAVDVVTKNKNSVESCKKLVDLSFSRGCKDDITVLVVHLANFIHKA